MVMAPKYTEKEVIIIKTSSRSVLAKGRIVHVYKDKKAYEVEFEDEITTIREEEILCPARLYCGGSSKIVDNI
jgi:hypothetical protein